MEWGKVWISVFKCSHCLYIYAWRACNIYERKRKYKYVHVSTVLLVRYLLSPATATVFFVSVPVSVLFSPTALLNITLLHRNINTSYYWQCYYDNNYLLLSLSLLLCHQIVISLQHLIILFNDHIILLFCQIKSSYYHAVSSYSQGKGRR